MANEREIAHQTQEKFEFYLIGLVFTLLALSVQTAQFGESNFADLCELVAWVSLLVSGVAGLWRLEHVPVWRMKLAYKTEFENKIDELRELMHTKGVEEVFVLETQNHESVAERLRTYEEGAAVLDPVITKLEEQNRLKYQAHRYAFILGLFLLLGSRGFPHVYHLLTNFGIINVT